jgi:hypothetical protein
MAKLMKNLINAYDVKALTTVGSNARNSKLEKAVPDATTRHLRPLLGAKLLAELTAFVVAVPEHPELGNLNAAAQTVALEPYNTALDTWRAANVGALLRLWDELKPCLAQWTLVEAWPDLLVHIEDAGIVLKTGNSNGTTSADAATLNQVWDAHRERAVFRGDELVGWLECNKVDYPAYGSTTPLASAREPSDWFGGISI